jgi:hypothetical protein
VGDCFIVKHGLPKCLLYTKAIYNRSDFKLEFTMRFKAERTKFQLEVKITAGKVILK